MNSQRSESGRLEFLPALCFLREGWAWILGGAVLLGGGALGASFAMTRIYEAEVIALPLGSQHGLQSLQSLMGGYGALASLAGIALPGSENPAEMAIVRIKSRGFVESFIEENDLLPELFPKKWDASKKSWRDPGDSPTLQEGYTLIINHVLRASIDKRSGMVTVEVRWTDPNTASSWANLLVARLNRVTREEAVEEASKSVIHLERELTNAQSVELRQSIATLLEAEINRRMIAITQVDYSLKVIDAARPSDRDHYSSPRLRLMTAIGAVIGALFGSLLAWVRISRVGPRSHAELKR